MKTSDYWLNLCKSYEKCSLTAFRDPPGSDTWSIGYGHHDPTITEGMIWTQDQAERQFFSDAQYAADAVNRLVTVPLTQGEFDGLWDFTYNLGVGALEGSIMLRLLNGGEYDAAAAQFQRWDHVHGVVVAGLLRRRIQEEQAFDGGTA